MFTYINTSLHMFTHVYTYSTSSIYSQIGQTTRYTKQIITKTTKISDTNEQYNQSDFNILKFSNFFKLL